MKKKGLFFGLIFCFFGTAVFAQDDSDEKASRRSSAVNISTAFGSGFAGDLSWQQLYGLGKSQKFRIGYGTRLNVFSGSSSVEYKSAPPEFEDDESRQAIFTAESSLIFSLNLGVFTEFHATDKLMLGFNIDALGFSFGGEKTGTLTFNGAGQAVKASPTSSNILLVGANDIGSLNSQFQVGYRLSEKLSLRAGMSMIFLEYTTDVKQTGEDNDRFRHSMTGGFIGLKYDL